MILVFGHTNGANFKNYQFIKFNLKCSVHKTNKSSSHFLSAGGDGSAAALALLLEKEGLNVGENSAIRDGGVSNHLVEFLVVSNSELNVTGNDSLLLGLDSGIPGKFDDLAAEVLKHGSGEDTSTLTNLLGVAASLVHGVDATNGERDVGSSGSADGLCFTFSVALSAWHFDSFKFKL